MTVCRLIFAIPKKKRLIFKCGLTFQIWIRLFLKWNQCNCIYYNSTQQTLALSTLNQPINIRVPARTSVVSGSHLWPPPNIGLKVSLHWWISKYSSTGKKTPAAALKSLEEIRKKKISILEINYLRTQSSVTLEKFTLGHPVIKCQDVWKLVLNRRVRKS